MQGQYKTQIEQYILSVVPTQSYSKGIKLGDNIDQQKNQKKQQSGIQDPRLGSAVFNDDICPTCQLDGKNCPGHFGYIELQQPIYNPIFLPLLHQILQIVCIKCGYFVIQESKIVKIQQYEKNHQKLIKKMAEQSKNAKCYNCEKQDDKYLAQPIVQLQYNKNTPYFQLVFKNGQIDKMEIQNVKSILEKINLQEFMQNLQLSYNPIDLIFSKYFPIPSPHIRAQPNPGAFDTGTCFQNQLTQLYQSLIKFLVQKSDVDLVYSTINEIFGTQSKDTKKKINRNSFKEKLDSKQGLIRQHIMQKRTDNSARAVVECSTDLQIDEVGVPIKILKNLSVPTKVTQQNIQLLQQLANNKKKYPGINYIQKLVKYTIDGNQFCEVKKFKNKGQELQVGDIVYRNPLRGEYCFLNRQPSLHLFSLIYMKIVPIEGSVLQINNANCEQTFNADFDGDEMNLFMPIINQYVEGLKIVSSIDNRMTSLSDGKLVIKPNHDTPFGMYIFTKFIRDQLLDKNQVMKLLSKTQFDKQLQVKDKYSGQQIIEYIIPDIFHSKYINTLITGPILQELFLDYYHFFGGISTKIYIQSIQNFSFQVIQQFSKTLSLQNCKSNIDFKKFEQNFKVLDRKIEIKASKLITSNYGQIDVQQFLEQYIIKKSLKFVSDWEKQIIQGFDENTNGYLQMVKAKSKGNNSHLVSLQILGIQLEGQQMFQRAAIGRYSAYNLVKYGLKEGNVIFDGLYNGINSQSEYLSQCAFSRAAMVTQKTGTKIPGYINRRLDYFMSSISVSYKYTLMVNNSLLLDLVFASNGTDVKYQRRQILESIEMNDEQIQQLFPGLEDLADKLISIRNRLRYSYYYSNYQWKIQSEYFHPIQYDDMISQSIQECHKKGPDITQQEYKQFVKQLIDCIQIIVHDKNNELLERLDKEFKIVLEAFVLTKMNYKKMIDKKISIDHLQWLYQSIIEKYNMQRVQPGEAIGVQCQQGFCIELTQKSIDSFHKVQSEGAQFIKIDHIKQIDAYLNKSGELQHLMVVRFKKKYAKDLEIAEQLKNYLMKKPLKNYVQKYSIFIDNFPTSKIMNSFEKQKFICNDFIYINAQQNQIDFKSEGAQKILQSYVFGVQLSLDKYKMEGDQIQIYQVIYGIALYLLKQINDKRVFNELYQEQLYLFYNEEGDKIQLRFQPSAAFNLPSLSDLMKTLIQSINLNYNFQNSAIDQIFIDKQQVVNFDSKGNIVYDFEYVILLFNKIENMFFLQGIKYIDYSRCEYNGIKEMQSYISIVLMQRILYKLLRESSQQVIGTGQVPYNVYMISQIMCHGEQIMQTNRYGIQNLHGSDALYQSGFEQQFTTLVDQASRGSQGNINNNYTSLILNSNANLGPNKSSIFMKADKQQIIGNILRNKEIIVFETEKLKNFKGVFIPQFKN